jgi:hypothetical protein
VHLVERDVADDRGRQRRNPDDIVSRPPPHVALKARDDIHGLAVHGETGTRPRLWDQDVRRYGRRAEARADLGHGVGQVALDVLDIRGARVDGRAREAPEQHGGAIEVIEVRMRDENGLEVPPLRGDAVGELFRIADPELRVDEDRLGVAVDEGRGHADALSVRSVDVEREWRGCRAGHAATAHGPHDGERDNDRGAQEPERAQVVSIHVSILSRDASTMSGGA